MNALPSFSRAILRGVCGRCPQCGQGKLLRRYLKPVEACAACGECYGHIRADDGPAWLTILIVGHVMAFFLLDIVPDSGWPDWLSLLIGMGVSLGLALLLLPRAKGLFIAIIWRMHPVRKTPD